MLWLKFAFLAPLVGLGLACPLSALTTQDILHHPDVYLRERVQLQGSITTIEPLSGRAPGSYWLHSGTPTPIKVRYSAPYPQQGQEYMIVALVLKDSQGVPFLCEEQRRPLPKISLPNSADKRRRAAEVLSPSNQDLVPAHCRSQAPQQATKTTAASAADPTAGIVTFFAVLSLAYIYLSR